MSKLYGLLTTIMFNHIYLKFTRGIRYISYIFTVGREVSITFMYTRCGCKIACNTVLGRNREDITPGTENYSFTVRGKVAVPDTLACILNLIACIDLIVGYPDSYFFSVAAANIIFIYITTLFKYYIILRVGWELNVVVGIICNFFSLLCVGVVSKEVHCTITIRQEEYLISYPHRDNLLSGGAEELFYLTCFIIKYPDIVGHTTLVVLPCSEFTKYPVKSQLCSIGRKRTETSISKGYFPWFTTFFCNKEKLSPEVVK